MRKFLIGLAIVAVVAQFIRPERNEGPTEPGQDDVFVRYPAPGAVQTAVRQSCYDCHSNRTVYPWYAEIQPVAAWLAHHVDEGKGELNFSTFGTYSTKRASHKLKESIEMLETDEMPLASYKWMHKEANWSAEQKAAFTAWAEGVIKQIEATPASP